MLNLTAGSIVAMDRAYNDYRLFAKWTEAGVLVRHPHEGERRLRGGRGARGAAKAEHSDDQIIRLSGVEAAAKCPHLLRSTGSVGDCGACPRARPEGQCDVRELLRDPGM